jgi:hypothetical protein
MQKFLPILKWIFLVTVILFATNCRKIKDLKDSDPDIQPLKEGFKTSAAIGYCATLAATVFSGGGVPENVLFTSSQNADYSGSGIMYVSVDQDHPLPFNDHIGDIVIAGLWDGDEGVITILFSDVSLFSKRIKFYGIHTVPVIRDRYNGSIMTVFARQDIMLSEGGDTLLNLSMSRPQFNLETDRLNEDQPDNVYMAVSQNVWFVTVDQQDTDYIYDDSYRINGGGQMAEVTAEDGGIQYHAMIETVFNFSECTQNPLQGDAFIQNIKAGENINLGNILLSFHDHCDGQAYVDVAAGQYLKYIGRDVNLNFE